jgi:TonB family protein
MASTKEQRIAAFSTLLISLLLLLTLVFLGFTTPEQKPEEQGILINFGDSEQGQGEVEPKMAEASKTEVEKTVQPVPVQATTKTEVGNEDVETQNFEEAAAIEKKKKENEKKKKDEEVKKQQEAENQRLAEVERQKQIEIENQKRIAEEQRKQRQQDSIRNRTKNAFAGRNPNGGNTGEGNTGGDGNQGALNGDINSKNRTGGGTGGDGIDFSLKGRSFGSAPPKPVYLSKSEGKVVVEISVDRNGNVIEARPGIQGTTTPDKVLHEAAKDAALKAKFDSNPNAPAVQKGTITYHFILQ